MVQAAPARFAVRKGVASTDTVGDAQAVSVVSEKGVSSTDILSATSDLPIRALRWEGVFNTHPFHSLPTFQERAASSRRFKADA